MTRRDEMTRIVVCDGKYAVEWGPNQPLHALRYGEEWRDCCGDGLILALAQEIDELRNDRLSAQAEPGYVVKPLEWSQKPPPGHDHEPFVYWASGIGGHYKADRDGTLWMAHDAFVWEPYETQKEAKAAAQADYEQRIRSAIKATVGTAEPGYVAGFEVAWHKARNAWMKASRHETQQKADEAAVQVLIAALPAPATASAGWQPIETAPKDGSEIWAFNGEQARMFWSQEFSLWVWDDELLNDVDPDPDQPTHWMPLPAAPTKRSAT